MCKTPARAARRAGLAVPVALAAAVLSSRAARGGTYDAPAGYYAAATATDPATLKHQLYTITSTGFTYRSYGDSRYTLNQLWVDPNNSADLLEVYTGTSVSGTWANGVAGSWNREHLFCENALGIKVTDTYKGYGSDLFELAPCDPNVNSSRGDAGYGYTGSALPGTYGKVAGTDGNTYWFPSAANEGEVARSVFYMATRYGEGQAGATTLDATNKYNLTVANGPPNSTGQTGDLNTLLHWAYEAPVDAAERRRNAMIYSGLTAKIGTSTTAVNESQGNRNPYIDHPEYIWAVYGVPAYGNNTSQLSVATPAAGGGSAASVDLGRVIAGTAFGTSAVTLSKSGTTPTTFNVTAGGTATSTLAGTGEAFDFGAQARSMSVGLATPGAAGPVAGSVTVHNTDLTTAAAGEGSADADDVVNVAGTAVDHSDASFSGTGDVGTLHLSFGSLVAGSGVHTLSFSVADLLSASGYTAGLDLDGITASGSTSALYTSLATFTDLAAGSSAAFVADLDTSTTGTYAAKFVLATSDEDIPGATADAPLELDLDGTVVTAAAPEPGSLLLVGLGAGGLLGRRRQRSATRA